MADDTSLQVGAGDREMPAAADSADTLADLVHEQPVTARSRRRLRWHDYTAFVLSGGGARGALQVGALRALMERGIVPDVLVGTSIGGWNAAVLGQDPTLMGVETLTAIWHSLSPGLVLLGREPSRQFPPQAQSAAVMLAAVRRVASGFPSLYSDAGAHILAERHLKNLTFVDLRIPVRIVATNISRGERTVFASGPLAPAVIASSAIPGVFPPVRIGEDVYVDGGVLDSLSLETALELGARRLFVLDVGYDASETTAISWTALLGLGAAGADQVRGAGQEPTKSNGKPNGRANSRASSAHPLAALLERTIQVMSRYHADHELAHVPPGIETHLLRLTSGASEGALAFGHAEDWIAAGYEAACTYLDAQGIRARQPVAARALEHAGS